MFMYKNVAVGTGKLKKPDKNVREVTVCEVTDAPNEKICNQKRSSLITRV